MRTFIAILIASAVAAAGAADAPVSAQPPKCGNSRNVPLPDLATAYRGLDFGLYPGRRNTPPEGYLAIGLDRTRRIRPLDVRGRPAANGRIILMSLGMSNTATEFQRFAEDARRTPALNRRLIIANGSLSGADAAMWRDPSSRPWQGAIAAATGSNMSVEQVQVVWVKQAHLRTSVFPDEIDALAGNLEEIVRLAKAAFPNLQIVYLSSRTRAGVETRRGPGEPQAYETAFAVRRVIERQIERTGNRAPDAPWVGWGPYLWSNGTPRSDGFVWDCGDVGPDMLHPTERGSAKVADQLMTFLMTAETAAPWFLEPSLANVREDIDAISASAVSGQVPLTVDFAAALPEPTQFFWSFDDGTFSRAPDPRKTFHIQGSYTVRLSAVEPSGKWLRSSVRIQVGLRK